MKLLTKTEVQQELAVERKQAIDEGIGFARKVDTLRQKASSEEAALEQFRTGTVAHVVKEIDELITQRDNLKVEVKSLEEQRDTALDPLYTKEAEVDKKLEALEVGRTELAERVSTVEEMEKSAIKREAKISTDRGLVDSLLTDVRSNLVAARDISLAAKVKADAVHADLNQREAKVLGREHTVHARELAVAARERDVDNRSKNVKKALKAITEREQLIADREQTYKRNVERDGKRSTGRK